MVASLWVAVGLFVVVTPQGAQLSPDAVPFESQAKCEQFLAETVTPYLDGEDTIAAYGVKCIELQVKSKKDTPKQKQQGDQRQEFQRPAPARGADGKNYV